MKKHFPLLFIALTVFILNSCKKNDSSNPQYKIGDVAFGGIIFYLDADNSHGLVCSISDQSTNVTFSDAVVNPWPYWGINRNFLDSTIERGGASTDTILNKYGTSGNIAASCRNYRGGGHNDWYLPTIDELRQLYKNRTYVSQLSTGVYWSSTSFGYSNVPYTVRVLNFNTGQAITYFTQMNSGYNSSISWWSPLPTANTRAVRKF
ncbi:uncharacterized protein DUF1566 [Mucilaginibacter gracilis]|uniref:Uncharacterized protein DUF1566 n=1 Tax=Mucilaginibacter gracilis TaxID=423350 RepID=A0A495J4R0_9SPHI|nr:DUF1566 domain-containing protein [Mucilaginibacter gracilis]RKR82969.1 uncharacterized protein DUF1566 [Mucilaginibacter gracilis]